MVNALLGAHSSLQWPGVSTIDGGWRLRVSCWFVYTMCVHGRQKFIFSVKRENNEYFCFYAQGQWILVDEWENDSWCQLTDGTLCHLAKTVSGSRNGFHCTDFGRLVVLAKGHVMPQIEWHVASARSQNNLYRIVNVRPKGPHDMSESRWIREGRSNNSQWREVLGS